MKSNLQKTPTERARTHRMAVGYSQKDERFLVRNSWGRNWGMKGYFTMPYEYVETLARDLWTVRG